MRRKGSVYYQHPMDCYCLTRATQKSGNVTKAWKCWWYDENMIRRYKSFACIKYGFLGARLKCKNHLLNVNQKWEW